MKHAKFRNRVLSALLAFVLASGMAVPSLAFSIDAEPQGGGLTWEKIDNNTVEVENPFRDAPVADYETVLYDDTDTVRVSIVLPASCSSAPRRRLWTLEAITTR